MVTKTVWQHREQMRGGKGSVEMYHVIPRDRCNDHMRMFAKIVVHPHSSIGQHLHEGETEPFYIESGRGLFIVNEARWEVKAGDVCTIHPGDSHSIENLSDTEDLCMIAVIYKNEG